MTDALRYRVDPACCTPAKAARRIGLSLDAFRGVAKNLYRRGFPQPDPDTGNYHLPAIDAWLERQNPHLFPQASLTNTAPPNSDQLFADGLEELRKVCQG